MNIKLTSTEEWKDGKNEGQLGEVFIRYVLLPLILLLCFVCTVLSIVLVVVHCFLAWNANGRCNNVLWVSEGGHSGERMRDD